MASAVIASQLRVGFDGCAARAAVSGGSVGGQGPDGTSGSRDVQSLVLYMVYKNRGFLKNGGLLL